MLAGMSIRDWPIDERPREKLLDKGVAALSDSLRKLIAADRQRFCAERGLGLTRFAELQAAVEIARRQLSQTLRGTIDGALYLTMLPSIARKCL